MKLAAEEKQREREHEMAMQAAKIEHSKLQLRVLEAEERKAERERKENAEEPPAKKAKVVTAA